MARREEHPDLAATTAPTSHAFSLFESIRSRVYRHVRLDYAIVIPNQVDMRSGGLVWASASSY